MPRAGGFLISLFSAQLEYSIITPALRGGNNGGNGDEGHEPHSDLPIFDVRAEGSRAPDDCIPLRGADRIGNYPFSICVFRIDVSVSLTIVIPRRC